MTNNITKKRLQFAKFIVFDSEDEIYLEFNNYGEASAYYENIIKSYKDREFYLMEVIHTPLRQTYQKYPISVKADGNVLYD